MLDLLVTAAELEARQRRNRLIVMFVTRVLLLTGLAVGACMWLGAWPALCLTCAAWLLMPQLSTKVE